MSTGVYSRLEEQRRRDILASGAVAFAGDFVKDRAALATYGDGASIFGEVLYNGVAQDTTANYEGQLWDVLLYMFKTP